ncbi:MAG: 50S ribosomal protein L29 [Nitrospirae bacterium]|nr:50S ribosomal protein L29 [Nitrospirota bacterium]
MDKRLAELKNFSPEELNDEETKLRKELFNLRFQKATGEIENPLRIRWVRRDIARVLTLKSEKLKAKS